MPLLVRKELGRLNLKDLTAIRTVDFTLDSLKRAKIFAGGILKFSPNVVVDSLQISTEVRGPSISGPYSSVTTNTGSTLASPAGKLYQGNMCAIAGNWLASFFTVGDCLTLDRTYPGLFTLSLAGKNNCVRQSNTIGDGAVYKCEGDGSGFSLLFTLLRPHSPNYTFGGGIDWGTYDVTVIVTGFETSSLVQNITEIEEQICCRVEDPNSKILYGDRPATSDLQSDFVETQLQACRVAENLIWQQNKVLEVSFAIPFRPAIRRGQTIRVLIPQKNIDFLGIIKTFQHSFNFDQATVITRIQATTTEYVFNSGVGSKNSQDKIDLRS